MTRGLCKWLAFAAAAVAVAAKAQAPEAPPLSAPTTTRIEFAEDIAPISITERTFSVKLAIARPGGLTVSVCASYWDVL